MNIGISKFKDLFGFKTFDHSPKSPYFSLKNRVWCRVNEQPTFLWIRSFEVRRVRSIGNLIGRFLDFEHQQNTANAPIELTLRSIS